eukprot:624564_1
MRNQMAIMIGIIIFIFILMFFIDLQVHHDQSSQKSITTSTEPVIVQYAAHLNNLLYRPRFFLFGDKQTVMKEKWVLRGERHFPHEYYDFNITNGDIVPLEFLQLCRFVHTILPNIHHYFTFVLITYFDVTVPYDCDRSHCMQRRHCSSSNLNPLDILLSNPYVLNVFTTLYDGTIKNPKIQGIPIGLYLGVDKAAQKKKKSNDTLSKQEGKMIAMLRDAVHNKYGERLFKIYLDVQTGNSVNRSKWLKQWIDNMGANYSHHNHYITNRSNQSDSLLKYYHHKMPYRTYAVNDIRQIKDQSLIYYETERIEQYEMYKQRIKYVFSISLTGNGLDCFRTWESLFFGNIVIVQKSPMDLLYKKHNLPVVMVDSYKDINYTMMRYWYHAYKDVVSVNNVETMKKLQMDYWMNWIRNETMSKLARVHASKMVG